jgi:hypothetical protein
MRQLKPAGAGAIQFFTVFAPNLIHLQESAPSGALGGS